MLFIEDLDKAWDTVVDAQSGAVLCEGEPGAARGRGHRLRELPGCPEGRHPGREVVRPDRESPSGYVDPTGLAGLGGPTTLGNNASTYANYSNFLVPADQGPRPVSPTSQFNYTYDMNWQKTKGGTVPPSYALDLNPAATNLFFHHNRIHDEFYGFGFTETAGNFQTDGGDPVLGLVHAGAASGGAPTYTGRDNAYMLTLPDGVPAVERHVPVGADQRRLRGAVLRRQLRRSVIEHEYAHGLSTRYVAGGEVARLAPVRLDG